LYPGYKAFLQGGGWEAGLERDYLFAGDGPCNPDVAEVDDQVLVGAVVVGSPRGVAKGCEIPLSKFVQVAEDVGDTAGTAKSAAWPAMYVFEPGS
jgi:hypothetical protein